MISSWPQKHPFWAPNLGENLENMQKLLYGTPVTGGKNKRKYNKRKLKTKIDKIPKKYILKL